MWKKLVNMTMVQNQKLYDRLDVTLSDKDIMGESLYNDMLPEVVDDLMKREILADDEKGYLGISGTTVSESAAMYNVPIGV